MINQKNEFEVWQEHSIILVGDEYLVREWIEASLEETDLGFMPILQEYVDEETGNFTVYVHSDTYEEGFVSEADIQRMESLGIELDKDEETHANIMKYLNISVINARNPFGVYKAELTDEDKQPTGEEITFCCSTVREVSLRNEIESGDLLIKKDSMKRIFSTQDRNEARSMATEF